MKSLVWIVAACLSVASWSAHAAAIDGEWLVEDGSAHVGLTACGDELFGVVSQEKEHGVDDKNPDPAKRNRPTLGMSLLTDMESKGPGTWLGMIYNAEDGKTYSARITLLTPTTLEVQGCVPGSLLCGSETWKKTGERRSTCRSRR